MLKIDSYAKVNLTLSVGGVRKDGYHNLDSIVQVINLCDALELEKSDRIEIICSNPDVPTDESNIIYKAASLFFSRYPLGGVRVKLDKRIPMQAGLGGGSGNAAAVLVGLNRLFDTEVSCGELAEIGAEAGSDVPLFVCGSPLLRMSGRGERVSPINGSLLLNFVIIKPEIGISTRWAYEMLDKRISTGDFSVSGLMEQAFFDGDTDRVLELVSNDFDEVCNDFDEVRAAKTALSEAGARAVCLSGSGSAVFGVFDDAESAYEGLKNRYSCFVARSVNRGDMYA